MANLKLGSKGKDVTEIQKALIAAGIKPRVKTNGVFDQTTDEAVKAFQKKNRLKVDGIVGKKTLPKIQEATKGQVKPADLKMDAPDYAKELKTVSKTYIDAKAKALKVIMPISKATDPEFKKLGKEYMEFLQGLTRSYGMWKKYATNAAKLQKQFYSELRNDPWSAKETMVKVNKEHAAAHFEMRMIDSCLDGFKRLNEEISEAGKKLAA